MLESGTCHPTVASLQQIHPCVHLSWLSVHSTTRMRSHTWSGAEDLPAYSWWSRSAFMVAGPVTGDVMEWTTAPPVRALTTSVQRSESSRRERKGSCRRPEEKGNGGRSKSLGKKLMLPPRVEIDPPGGSVAGIRVAPGSKTKLYIPC
jgi:hypothetical protein